MFRAARFSILAGCFAWPLLLAAWPAPPDSLRSALRAHSARDSVRADMLLQLVVGLEFEQPDTALGLVREALAIARELKDHDQQTWAMMELSELLSASFDSSYYYLRQCLPLARKARKRRLLGHVYDKLCYIHLGNTISDQNNAARNAMWEKAILYCDSAIAAFATSGHPLEQAGSLARKAETLMFLGRSHEAIGFLREAMGLVNGADARDRLSVIETMAQYHRDHGRADSGMYYDELSLRISEELEWKPQIAFHRAILARTLATTGEHERALRMAAELLDYTKEHHLNRERLDAIYTLYIVNREAGRLREALHWHETLLAYSDSSNAVMAQESMNKLHVQLENVKNRERLTVMEKDQQINEQKRGRQRTALFALGGGTLLLVVLALVIQNRYRLKRRALKESEEQKAIIAKEHARSEELLLNILPHEVAEELKAKGAADAVHIDQVTVLFTDFKGFTAMSERVTPKELVHDLNECFSAFDRITEKHGIEKIKTIGDAYMAAGGLPTPNETHASDVIKAALEMRDFVAEGKARKVAAGLPYFEIRIGIHTGPVVAGIVGVKKFAYDIWGDTVNTASRMESSGEVGQVNISEATYALVKEVKEAREGKEVPAFTFTPRGKVQAKGKGEMEMYFVHSAS